MSLALSKSVPTQSLSSGQKIPALGLGTYRSSPGPSTEQAVLWAFEAGYRHVDTAAIYGNEADVGTALVKSGLPRSDIFVTTKLWNSRHGDVEAACRESLRKLQTDYLDLYLMHSPLSRLRVSAWKEMLRLQKEGLCRTVGVSNFGEHHLRELEEAGLPLPAVNQIEVHPFLQRRELVAYCQARGILVQAYSPLAKAERLDDPRLRAVADRVARTPAQVLIRWSLQKGLNCIPKSVSKDRIAANFQVWDWELDGAAMAELDGLEAGLVTGWDPVAASLAECDRH